MIHDDKIYSNRLIHVSMHHLHENARRMHNLLCVLELI